MICIIDCGTSWLEELKKNVQDSGQAYKVITARKLQEHSLHSFSGIIISGSPMLLTKVDLQKHLRPFLFLKTTAQPVLGICHGHQVLGVVYGSSISLGSMIEKKESITFVKHDTLFSGVKNHSLFQEAHCEFITLPKDFSLLARSNSCKNEAMRHKSKMLYGVQFHPEVSGSSGKKIIKNFLELCTTYDVMMKELHLHVKK